MGLKSACCVGCCVTIAIVALLIGINGLMQHRADQVDHDDAAAFQIPGNCTLQQVFERATNSRDGTCIVKRYVLALGPTPDPSAPSSGVRIAYSNFFPTRCGGVAFAAEDVGEMIPCWLREGEATFARVSPVFPADEVYLTVGAIAIALAVLILLLFVGYNIVLWIGVCADMGPFSRASIRRRNESRRAAARADAPVATNTEPVEPADIEVADHGWLTQIAFNNAYARAVLRKFGMGDASRQPDADAKEDDAASAPVGVDPDTEDAPPERQREMVAVRPEATRGDEAPLAAPVSSSSSGAVECCVCYEVLRDEAIAFPCFHVTCAACFARLAGGARDGLVGCPMCRRAAFAAEMRRVRRDDVAAVAADSSIVPVPSE